jgi:hypothetical protein
MMKTLVNLNILGAFLRQILPNYTASHRVRRPSVLAVSTQVLSTKLKLTTQSSDYPAWPCSWMKCTVRWSVWVGGGTYRVHDPLGPLLFVQLSLLPCEPHGVTYSREQCEVYCFLDGLCISVNAVFDNIEQIVVQTFLTLSLSFQ